MHGGHGYRRSGAGRLQRLNPGRRRRYVGGRQRQRLSGGLRDCCVCPVLTVIQFRDSRGHQYGGSWRVGAGRLWDLTGRGRVHSMTLGDRGHPLWRGWWRTLSRCWDYNDTAARLRKLGKQCRVAVAVSGFGWRDRWLLGMGRDRRRRVGVSSRGEPRRIVYY